MNYYLIGVGLKGIHSNKPGEKELDFFIHYTDKDLKKAKLAVGMSKNEMWKSSDNEIISLTGANIFIKIKMMSIRARAQDLMVCLYNSKSKFRREDFEIFVKVSSLEELKKARVTI